MGELNKMMTKLKCAVYPNKISMVSRNQSMRIILKTICL